MSVSSKLLGLIPRPNNIPNKIKTEQRKIIFQCRMPEEILNVLRRFFFSLRHIISFDFRILD